DIFQPVLASSPGIFFFILAAIPWVVVRTRRRKRVLEIEQDLPSILELLATLSQAGMGFDAALGRVLLSQQEERTLAQELRLFQLETLAGVPRIRAFRRLSERVRIPYMSTFVGAMVQAEQTGAGLSAVLRVQAQELRNRRREKALVQAESLPVKLTFPLVICFLPAVFIVTLGPAFHSFFQVADSVLRSVK
ncbi:MAG: type II secretion system F family protein, partial [Planctomycetota bacterium]